MDSDSDSDSVVEEFFDGLDEVTKIVRSATRQLAALTAKVDVVEEEALAKGHIHAKGLAHFLFKLGVLNSILTGWPAMVSEIKQEVTDILEDEAEEVEEDEEVSSEEDSEDEDLVVQKKKPKLKRKLADGPLDILPLKRSETNAGLEELPTHTPSLDSTKKCGDEACPCIPQPL